MEWKTGISLLIVFLTHLLTGSDGLKDVRIELVSKFIRRGENLKLFCKYDLQDDALYMIKWFYIGITGTSSEFYRYVPKEAPPQQTFEMRGANVDVVNSNEHIVILKNVSLQMSAKYKCSVSVENTFQTLFDIKEIFVVAAGYGGLHLSVDRMLYHPGDKGVANCTVPGTHPPSNISWFIDDKEVTKESRTVRIDDSSDRDLSTTTSTLAFELPENFSPLELKCVGELYDVYRDSAVFTIQTQARHSPVSSPDTKPQSNSAIRGSSPFAEALLVLGLLAGIRS